MKKSLFFIVLAIAALFSAASYASGGYGHRGEWGEHHHGHHHDHWRPHHREVIRYYPPRPYYREVIKYYPPRPRPIYREEIHHYPAPRPQPYPYYPQHDLRSSSGLAGGVVGSVFGYQLGNGDPLATGIGAAAGSMIGNGLGQR
jgi:hypothetical protein